jgi:ADP-heptose:LPS heptosyltransferase
MPAAEAGKNPMENRQPYGKLFALSSGVTDLFPKAGARLLDRAVTTVFGNRYYRDLLHRRNVQRLRYLREFSSILVIGDLNIGDAVNLQAAITALRDYFPEAEIDYTLNCFAKNLVQGNPEITRLWPVFTGACPPEREDFPRIEEIVALHRYSLILNFCPLFKESRLQREEDKVINYRELAAAVLSRQRSPTATGNIVYCSYRFVYDLFAAFLEQKRVHCFRGTRVTLADRAVRQAIDLMKKAGLLYAASPVIFLNPDASSPCTRIPVPRLIELIFLLAGTGRPLLLGASRAVPGLEGKLLATLPPRLRLRCTIVPPSVPLDAYAALIDFADVYISADTGPLHIAAARKYSASGNYRFRNRTAVVSVFGATPERIYGYDSSRPGYFAANQDAPSFACSSVSACRNITCINKMAKTCAEPRCFDGLDTGMIVDRIQAYLAKGTERTVLHAPAPAISSAEREPACHNRRER